MKNCIKCNSPIQTTAKTGRPAVYCSTACRRAAEYEIGRINRRLIELEDQLIFNKAGKDNTRDARGLTRTERVEALQVAIAESEQRLRSLLAANDE